MTALRARPYGARPPGNSAGFLIGSFQRPVMPTDRDEADSIRHLRANGPTARPDVPGNLTSERVRSRTNVFRMSTGTGTAGIVYLDDHDPDRVVRTWVEENRETAERLGAESVRRRLRRAAPDGWAETVSDVLDDAGFTVDHSDRGAETYDGETTCPLCDETVSDLSTHLQSHD